MKTDAKNMSRRGFITLAGGALAATALAGCAQGQAVEAAADATADAGADELFAAHQDVVDSPDWVTALPQAQDADVTQLFVVAAMAMDRTTATISMNERDDDGAWKQVLSTPGFVGKNGLCLDAEHVEGCGQTPSESTSSTARSASPTTLAVPSPT